jgi:lipopolysaccharide/colanic/teichoic acid biosynthesis glycosyltransferase
MAAKRLFDICFSLVVLVVTAPLLLIIAVAIKLDSPGPVFFKQERIGLHSQPFTLYKFRTMVQNASQIGPEVTTRDDPRITRMGAFLRKWYLDEIPQFVNVLRGEMSVVGPRPETPRYVALYTPEERRVLQAKPGMAGPATIAYRNEEALLAQQEKPDEHYVESMMRDRLRLDLRYVENQSFFYDLRVLFEMFRAALFASPDAGDEHLPSNRDPDQYG